MQGELRGVHLAQLEQTNERRGTQRPVIRGLTQQRRQALGATGQQRLRGLAPGGGIGTAVGQDFLEVIHGPAVAAGRVARTDLTAFHARQIAGLGDAALTRRLGEVWGTVQVADADHSAAVAQWRTQMNADRLQAANLPNGRKVFSQACAPCHQLYGEGGSVGPDLTGSGRASLDYLLENIVAPSAVVAADYRMTVATLKDGSVLNGVLREPTARTVALQSQTERRVLERSEIQTLESSEQSMMPEGLLSALPANDARDLLAYLMHPRQVPLGR